MSLKGYSDSDWGASIDDRRSITGYCYILSPNGPVVTWKSRKQATVALSTCEAEYMATAEASKEALYLLQLVQELTGVCHEPAEIRCDNQGAIALAENPVKHSRSKHIDIRYHFIRSHLKNNKILLQYVRSNENLADIFTKPCSKQKLVNFRSMLFGV